MRIVKYFAVFLFVFSLSNAVADPATSPNVTLSGHGLGADMWNGVMSRRGYFVPSRQASSCGAGEAHVQVLPNGLGYCIETSVRAGTATWEVARHDCLQDGMRLPEPGELKYACNNAAGFVTAGVEWASNVALPITAPLDLAGVVSAVLNTNSGCDRGSYSGVASDSGEESRFYRCMR